MAARCRAELGDVAGAESILRDMARGPEGDGTQRRIVLLELACVLTARGDHAAALETYERSLALFGPGDAGVAAVLLIERSLSLAALGRVEDARADCLEALRTFREQRVPLRTREAQMHLAAFEIRLGLLDEAAPRCGELTAAGPEGAPDACSQALAWRLLDALEEARRKPRARDRARRMWTRAYLEAPPALQERIGRWLGLAGIGLPRDHVIRTAGNERAVDIAAVAAIRRDPAAFDLVIDVEGERVFRAGAGWIDLSRRPKLLHVLFHLASGGGAAYGAEALFRALWGPLPYDAIALRQVVHSTIYRLRRLVEAAPERPRFLRSRIDRSYFFEEGARTCLLHSAHDRTRLELTARQRLILALLEDGAALTNRDCVRRFRVSQRTAHRDLDGLARAGFAASEGRGRATRYRLAGR
jgi:hypothetical protein